MLTARSLKATQARRTYSGERRAAADVSGDRQNGFVSNPSLSEPAAPGMHAAVVIPSSRGGEQAVAVGVYHDHEPSDQDGTPHAADRAWASALGRSLLSYCINSWWMRGREL